MDGVLEATGRGRYVRFHHLPERLRANRFGKVPIHSRLETPLTVAIHGVADLVRIFVNPWDQCREGVTSYLEWKDHPQRQREHWSVRYIGYFGFRTFIPRGTSFTGRLFKRRPVASRTSSPGSRRRAPRRA